VGCIIIGKRLGYPKEPMPPHSLTLTMVGASLLWVGWFGFNAGSNLEANAYATLAFINTFVATAAAALSWIIVEQLRHGRPSILGAVTGAVAGLVAITPASGFASPMGAIVLGLIVSPICYIFISQVKQAFGFDDSLDVFGLHAVAGIVGAIGTGIVADPALGGAGYYDFTQFPAVVAEYSMGAQVWIQIKAVAVTVVWTAVVSAVLFLVIKAVFGLRSSPEDERQGLDQTSHGETAYNP
jgi:Amt family ammonium transporter